MIDREPKEIRIRTYKGPLIPNGGFMGYKGSSCMDSGYIYAPYVPITQSPVVLDPNILIPIKDILTSYGSKLIDEAMSFYGTETIEKRSRPYRSITDAWEVSRFDG